MEGIWGKSPARGKLAATPEGRGESPLWLAQASKLAPAHALCGTILATILHLRSHRRATMSAGVSPRRRAASSLAKRDR